LFVQHGYQKASLMIPMFVDIVSKNGNLLLSIPLPGHGEPDSDELAFLEAFADWQQINGEAIKGSRPWSIYGEGPSTEARPKLQSYQLSQLAFDARDIRFTTKGNVLYAIALGWPDSGRIVIQSLAEGAGHYPGQVAEVRLLGSDAKLNWTRTAQGLEIDLGGIRPPSPHAIAFRITPV
ncbi:MAG: alpha-L-fucosidase C-terminal domain-containing protein, partial [Asticcacaulis sp.]